MTETHVTHSISKTPVAYVPCNCIFDKEFNVFIIHLNMLGFENQ